MQLSEMLIEGVHITGSVDGVTLTGVTSDSRDVRPGFLFAGFAGQTHDGSAFIKDAIAKGAIAILAKTGAVLPENSGAVLITHDNPRFAFAKLAALFFGAQIPVVVAVTGTNGKSSTVAFCRQIWETLGLNGASLGTVGITGAGINRSGALTTPDPITLHSAIAELHAAGATHLAMEASSIGLDQYRMHGVNVTAAGFANLTRDHLDYHGNMDVYFESKTKIFTEVLSVTGTAVVNVDANYGEQVVGRAKMRGIRVIEVGTNGREIRIIAQKPLPDGMFLTLDYFGERRDIELPLVGSFQAENALLALGLVVAEKQDDKDFRDRALTALESLQSVRGRLELAGSLKNGAAVYVDYAHTPDGLETMLTALRPHCHGKLHVVFGCGGDRDKGKRPMMGGVAVKCADHVIVTDDNPRTEEPEVIRAEVMAGCPNAVNIGGRRDAIRAALKNLRAGDVLVVAGKGHEQGQIVGKDILPFDDVTEVKTAIKEGGL